MRCGVLCDKDGNVKRTWALISDVAITPVEDGDHVIEWECDHGEHTIDPVVKSTCTQAAIKEQGRIMALKTHDEVRAHGEKRGHDMTTQAVLLATPSTEPVYYGAGKGLLHRTMDAEGDVQERAVHPSNVIHIIDHQPSKKTNAKG